jgi:4-azaleucine resistance transporter AzlC
VPKIDTFIKGILDILPLMIPVVPFGIIYGVIGVEIGFSPMEVFAMSFVIFAGSSQIAFAQLFAAGASPLVMISSVAVINSRHILYGAVLAEYLGKLRLTWKIILSYLMADQAFSVSSAYFKKNVKNKNFHFHMLGSGLTLWSLWQLSTLIGIVLGNIVPAQLGLEFAIPLTFFSLILSELRKLDHVIIILISGICSVLTYNFPFKIYIIFSAIFSLGISIIINKKFK